MHVRLMTMGTMSTLRRTNVSGGRLQGGVVFYDEVVGVRKVVFCAISPFSNQYFTEKEYLRREEVWPLRRGSSRVSVPGV
jgi:hypothetical protein